NFSELLRVKFCSVASFFRMPEYTLKNEMRPENGSLMVLKTKSDNGSESLTLRVAGSVVGRRDGLYGPALGRGRKVVHDKVQHLVGAHVAEAGGEQHRKDLV